MSTLTSAAAEAKSGRMADRTLRTSRLVLVQGVGRLGEIGLDQLAGLDVAPEF